MKSFYVVWTGAALLGLWGAVGCSSVPEHRADVVGTSADRPFAGQPYERHHRWKDWRVTVLERSQDHSTLSWYQVQVARFKPEGEEILYGNTLDFEGTLERTWLDDVRGKGWPALVLFTRSKGTGAYGSLRILECGKAAFRTLPTPKARPERLKGYRGNDQWRWEGGSLFREFPVFRKDDPDSEPGGGRRVLRFTWEKGKWRVRYKTEPGPGDSSGLRTEGP